LKHSLKNWVAFSAVELAKLKEGDPVVLNRRAEYGPPFEDEEIAAEDWTFVEWRGRFLFLASTEKFPAIVEAENVNKLVHEGMVRLFDGDLQVDLELMWRSKE
jgi:hypothetical protein